MNYELAKKLKDAGFPPPKVNGDFAINNNTLETIPVPTLSELIETCGDELVSIIHLRPNDWVASTESCSDCGTYAGSKNLFLSGSTPEEAVANLWLKLNN